MIITRSAQGTANIDVTLLERVSGALSGVLLAGHCGVTTAFALIGPSGNRPCAVTLTLIESPGRMTGSTGGFIVAEPAIPPDTVMSCAPASLTLPVFTTV